MKIRILHPLPLKAPPLAVRREKSHIQIPLFRRPSSATANSLFNEVSPIEVLMSTWDNHIANSSRSFSCINSQRLLCVPAWCLLCFYPTTVSRREYKAINPRSISSTTSGRLADRLRRGYNFFMLHQSIDQRKTHCVRVSQRERRRGLHDYGKMLH